MTTQQPGAFPKGLGAPARGGLPDDVLPMLRMGFPRIAYALAVGVPFAPWVCNLRATWDTTDVQTIPSVGNDERICQDVIVDGLVARITADRTPENQFDNQSDYFGNWQSNIEMTLSVSGAPRYEVAARMTPISNLCDVFNGNSKWPSGWVLQYQNALKAFFHNRIPLQVSPTTVVVTLRGWQCVTDLLVNMTNAQAVTLLREIGYSIPDSYLSFLR